MRLETFFEKFELFADAPNAVGKMRELILESAIRGNLVPRNANDAPASQLLKRVEALRSSSVQAGKVRKQVALSPVGDDAYLQIPRGWEWTRLGNTGRIFIGDSVSESGKAELAKIEDGLPFIATKDVGYGRDTLVYDNGLKVALGDTRFKVARAKAVLICAEGGSAGRKIGIADRDICFGNKLYANEVWEGIHPRYIFYVYQAPTFFREFAARMTGIIGGIARSEFLSLPIPLPPEEEQKRIVAKVDELMALCDRLEAQQQERDTRHAALARASLSRFAEAPTPANLDFLFHKSYPIIPADLRKTILTLAVQGKLVPQDPNDEPAQDMLNKIETEKKRLSECGGLKADKKAWVNSSTNPPHDIPESWCWVRLQDVFEISRGGSPRPAGDPRFFGGTIPWITVGEVTKDSSKYLTETTTGLTEEGSERSRFINPGDLLLTNSGATLGVPKISKIRGCMNDGVAVLRLFHTFDLNDFGYLYLTHQTPAFRNVNQGMGQPNLNTPIIAGWFFPLPPLVEQHRIVAKVEQLMVLVDQLETQLTTARATAKSLMDAVVVELTESA